MNEYVYSVGRPKLANETLKSEGMLIITLSILSAFLIGMVGISILTREVNSSKLSANLSLSNAECRIDKYKVNKTTYKVILSCNKNVAKASLDGEEFLGNGKPIKAYKYYSVDTNKVIDYSYNINDKYNKIKFYKLGNK